MKTMNRAMMGIAATLWLLAPAADATASGIHFDHTLHVEEVELDCSTCHESVASSTDLAGQMLPGMDTCGNCHDVDDEEGCSLCHTDADDPSGFSPVARSVDRFNHSSHIQDQGLECRTCHGGAPEYSGTPEMAGCRSCHETASGLQDCTLCHSAGAELVPENHMGLWESWHGIAAGGAAADCGQCHAQVDCQECHSGDNVRPRVHPLNYEFNHSVAARSSEIECGTCHLDPGFCADCHRDNLIIPQNHADPGWINGSVHGPEAMFELESCVSCHDAGPAVPAGCDGPGCHLGG